LVPGLYSNSCAGYEPRKKIDLSQIPSEVKEAIVEELLRNEKTIDLSQIPSEVREAIEEELLRNYDQQAGYADTTNWLRALARAEKKPNVIAAREAYEELLRSEVELILGPESPKDAEGLTAERSWFDSFLDSM
jgi:hypothetical protein